MKNILNYLKKHIAAIAGIAVFAIGLFTLSYYEVLDFEDFSGNIFRMRTSWRVQMVEPNGGESYLAGDTINFKWQYRLSKYERWYTADIELAVKNSRETIPVVSNTRGTEYTWEVPSGLSGNYLVKITAKMRGRTKGTDYSDGTINIKEPVHEQGITRGEAFISIWDMMKNKLCAVDKCTDMTGGMPEEIAACNLHEYGIFDSMQLSYDDYTSEINRSAFTKMVITAIDGLAGYEKPATPTFDDTPASAWYYDYVEAAVQLGLITGYTDAGGNLTGMFGPGDGATKEWTDTVLSKVSKKECQQPGSLSVTKAAMPVSQTYVKGEDDVPALGFVVTSDSDITIKTIAAKAYGDDDGTFDNDGVGDTSANNIISAAALYDQNGQEVAGPESVTSNGIVTFDNLNISLGTSGSKTFIIKVHLLNTFNENRYLAMDVWDIKAEDGDSNTVNVSGIGFNYSVNPDPMLTIVVQGNLRIYREGYPVNDNAVAGDTEKFVNKYRFSPVREGFIINKLTIINDQEGAFDTAVPTSAISQVTIKYPDENGNPQNPQSRSMTLSGGSATFSNLGFYAPKDEDSWLEIYADINTKSAVGESISGKTFRLGLQDTGNTASTFEAVGEASSSPVTPAFYSVGGTAVGTFTVRKTVPVLSKVNGSSMLTNGENTFYGLTVAANPAGFVGLARMVFDVTVQGAGATSSSQGGDINSWKLQGYTSGANGHLSIFCTDENGNNAFYIGGGSIGLEDCDGRNGDGIADGTYKVIVAFSTEQTIPAGSSKIYSLQGTAAGFGDNSSVVTRLAIGDDSVAVSGITGTVNESYNGNENTGRIYSSTPNGGLFTGMSYELSNYLGAARNFIWSDKSADSHAYPTVTYTAIPYAITTDTGSYDWTNGYKLNAANLAAQTLSY